MRGMTSQTSHEAPNPYRGARHADSKTKTHGSLVRVFAEVRERSWCRAGDQREVNCSCLYRGHRHRRHKTHNVLRLTLQSSDDFESPRPANRTNRNVVIFIGDHDGPYSEIKKHRALPGAFAGLRGCRCRIGTPLAPQFCHCLYRAARKHSLYKATQKRYISLQTKKQNRTQVLKPKTQALVVNVSFLSMTTPTTSPRSIQTVRSNLNRPITVSGLVKVALPNRHDSNSTILKGDLTSRLSPYEAPVRRYDIRELRFFDHRLAQ